ncbi:MAG: hypothetical protein BAJALOKI1v1_510010 [Promethearchaeota archaeon]|nr:MAG: hypothetical protein BAJALOKI1v1_510010 [Candidatus Lokiarchaeota archaeon]
MQLLNLSWDEKDQSRLLFKFKKEPDEINEIIEESVERAQIKFELLKRNERSPQIIQEPFLISIKDLYFSANLLAFSVKFDKLNDLEDLQIRVIRLTIFYYSGRREDILINKTFQLTEITYDDGQLVEFMEEEVVYEKKTTYSYKRTSVSNKGGINAKNKAKTRKGSSAKATSSTSYQRSTGSHIGERRIPISNSEYQKWLELKGDKPWDTTLFMVREGFKKLQELENELKEAKNTFKQIALNKSSAPAQPVYLQAPPNLSGPPTQLPSPPQRAPPSVNRKHSLENANAKRVLREEKDQARMSQQIQVMREMKEKFEKISDVKELLNKVPEEELTRERAKTDHAGFLEFKLAQMKKSNTEEPSESTIPQQPPAPPENIDSSEVQANADSSEAQANADSSEAQANADSSEAQANADSFEVQANADSSEVQANTDSSEVQANADSPENSKSKS